MSTPPQDKDSYQLWRSSNLAVLEQLKHERTIVTIGLPNGFDGVSPRVQLKGVFRDLREKVASFVVEQCNPHVTGKPVVLTGNSLACEVGFTHMQRNVAGFLEPVGYSGSGEILQLENGPDGQPKQLVVRVAHRFTTRLVRRHFRLEWSADMPATVGLHVVSAVPQNRQELRELLEVSLRDTAHRPYLVNISAGGVCLCVDKDMASRPLVGREFYMFIFTCPVLGSNRPPEILACKKAGLRRGICDAGHVGMRFKFLHELNWRASQVALVWRDIAETGSATINKLVEDYCATHSGNT